ncbi:hypothetical protein TrVFT333_001726 [Trichoderma virens FT-333]|nr:hypothetical protein TrVFT333_001726 [Trichoderma virens FT-333]
MSQGSPQIAQAVPQEASSQPQSIRRQPDINAYSASWNRPLKQFSLFFLGAAFTAASVGVSRRSVIRRQRESFPKFYSSNGVGPHDGPNSEGAILGVQALGLATLNELRVKTKAAMERPGGEVNPEDEKEFEQMMDNLMAKLGMDKASVESGGEGDKRRQKLGSEDLGLVNIHDLLFSSVMMLSKVMAASFVGQDVEETRHSFAGLSPVDLR